MGPGQVAAPFWLLAINQKATAGGHQKAYSPRGRRRSSRTRGRPVTFVYLPLLWGRLSFGVGIQTNMSQPQVEDDAEDDDLARDRRRRGYTTALSTPQSGAPGVDAVPSQPIAQRAPPYTPAVESITSSEDEEGGSVYLSQPSRPVFVTPNHNLRRHYSEPPQHMPAVW